MSQAEDRFWKNLTIGVIVFVITLIFHNANHARLGLEHTPEAVIWAGTFVFIESTVIVTLVAVRHRLAPLFSFIGGASIAASVSASHLLPRWGPLSDPLLTEPSNVVTRIAAFSEIFGAIFLAYMGWQALRTVRVMDKLTNT